MKFGGNSLATAERLEAVVKLIQQQRAAGQATPRAVVCSAMGQTTDALLQAAHVALERGHVDMDAVRLLYTNALQYFDELPSNTAQEITALLDECKDLLQGVALLQELSTKTMDQLVSYGEQCTARIVAACLNQKGVPAQAFDAWDVGIVTDSNFGRAKILPKSQDNIRNTFAKIDPSIIAVVTGFIGRDAKGRITTLGRGGDLTATYIGAALAPECDEIQIYKDVDGILTSDPRVVPHAIPVAELTYDEASEMAHFGAQVMHPAAMHPAAQSHVPVRVMNSLNPAAIGTMIGNEKQQTCPLVTAITYKRDVTLLDIQSTQALGAYGFLANVFRLFEQHKLSVDVLASSEVSISLTFDKKQRESDIAALVHDLSVIARTAVKSDKSILTLIADVNRSSLVLATVFAVFAQRGIKVKMMSQGASKVNISFILNSYDLDKAILALHECFFEGSDTAASRRLKQHERDENEFMTHMESSNDISEENDTNQSRLFGREEETPSVVAA